MRKTALVKIGGSILKNKEAITSTISQLTALQNKMKGFRNIIIIPGGGSYANLIRYIDKRLKIGDIMAHWEAILCMDKNAEDLHKQFPSTLLCEEFSELSEKIKENVKDSQLIIFKPFKYLYETDRLPHSWKVTSDSIALHIAFELALEKCFLIKNVDGIIDREGKVIKSLTVKNFKSLKESKNLADIGKNAYKQKQQSTPIDSYCLKLIERYKIPIVILNGTPGHPRITQFFNVSESQSTTLYPT
jgi:hypothetical protein